MLQHIYEELTAFHGSPHLFSKFDPDKIGTGEGRQSYGWGFYFTDSVKRATDYAQTLTIRNKGYTQFPDGRKFCPKHEDVNIAIEDVLSASTPEEFNIKKTEWLSDWSEDFSKEPKFQELINILSILPYNSKFIVHSPGIIYAVKLHPGKHVGDYNWLMWDRPVNVQTSETIVNGFIKMGKINPACKDAMISKFQVRSGKILYNILSKIFGSDKLASLFLINCNIHGMKYPADAFNLGTSMDTSDGYNYVVYDPRIIRIVGRKPIDPITGENMAV